MRFETSVVVNRPIDELVPFFMDLPFNLPRARGWTLGLRWTSPGPPGVGSTFQQRVVILGVEAQINGVFTEWDPPRGGAVSFTGAGVRSGSVRFTLEPVADGTKMALRIEIRPRPAFTPLWWIAGPFLKRRWMAGVPRMKELIEAGRG